MKLFIKSEAMREANPCSAGSVRVKSLTNAFDGPRFLVCKHSGPIDGIVEPNIARIYTCMKNPSLIDWISEPAYIAKIGAHKHVRNWHIADERQFNEGASKGNAREPASLERNRCKVSVPEACAVEHCVNDRSSIESSACETGVSEAARLKFCLVELGSAEATAVEVHQTDAASPHDRISHVYPLDSAIVPAAPIGMMWGFAHIKVLQIEPVERDLLKGSSRGEQRLQGPMVSCIGLCATHLRQSFSCHKFHGDSTFDCGTFHLFNLEKQGEASDGCSKYGKTEPGQLPLAIAMLNLPLALGVQLVFGQKLSLMHRHILHTNNSNSDCSNVQVLGRAA